MISAGRGMVEKENLEMIETLANKLNAAIGGTRAIVDAGWMPYSQQVGQTGKTVKPDIYIACGISGATQHQVGMKDSKFVIAIKPIPTKNKNKTPSTLYKKATSTK